MLRKLLIGTATVALAASVLVVSPASAATGAVTSVDVGAQPTSLAFSPDGTIAYVTNAGDDSVSVIDSSGAVVGDAISVGDEPGSVAFAPDGKKAYVSNYGSDTVSVIEVAAPYAEHETYEVGSGPVEVAVSPDGTVAYVANYYAATVSVIHLETGVVTTIDVGDYPWGVAFSPDGTLAYVSNSDSASVSVIGVQAGEVTKTIPVGGSPYYAAFAPDGMVAFVVNYDDETVSVIDVETGTVVKTIATFDGSGAYTVAFSPDGSVAFLTNYSDGSVSVVDTATQELIGEPIDVGSSPYYVAFRPDGTAAYVANYSDASVSIIALDPALFTAPETALTVGLGLAVGYPAAGTTVAVKGVGLQAKSAYELIVESTPTSIASGSASSTGTFTDTGVMPTGLEAGRHTVTLSATGVDGSAITRVAYFTIDSAGVVTYVSDTDAEPLSETTGAVPLSETAVLASTGFEGASLGFAALLLFLTGAGLTLRRRRSAA